MGGAQRLRRTEPAMALAMMAIELKGQVTASAVPFARLAEQD
jgi:hypothetical protein